MILMVTAILHIYKASCIPEYIFITFLIKRKVGDAKEPKTLNEKSLQSDNQSVAVTSWLSLGSREWHSGESTRLPPICL